MTARQLGLKLSYRVQPAPDGLAQAFLIGADFLNGSPACLILGDNLFYGHDLSEALGTFGCAEPKERPFSAIAWRTRPRTGSWSLTPMAACSRWRKSPPLPRSDYAVPGLYFLRQPGGRTGAAAAARAPGANWKSPISTDFTSNGAVCTSNALAVARHGWIPARTIHFSRRPTSSRRSRPGRDSKSPASKKSPTNTAGSTPLASPTLIQRLGKTTYADYLRRSGRWPVVNRSV